MAQHPERPGNESRLLHGPRGFVHSLSDPATNFRLAIIMFFGTFGVLAITPFGVMRLLSGEWLIGIVDMLIVATIATMSLYAWRTGNTTVTAAVVALTNTVGCIVIVLLLGRLGLYWAYMVILANFMLMPQRRLAALLSLALLAVAASQQHLFETMVEQLSFVTTASMLAVCALIFVERSDLQHLRLAHMARRDALTGLGNRRLMEEELDLLMAGALGPVEHHALAVIDIDRFKGVNDRFGHEAGDLVLRDLAELLGSRIRRRDRLYRMGGEEFLLLLEGVDHDSLYAVLDSLRAAVAADLAGPGGRLTVSIGGARHAPGDDWRRWLARADAAMYDAKQGGRNRVCIGEHEAGACQPARTGERRKNLADTP